MVEYIYLSTEERKIFSINYLEYLIDELQFDNNFNISDNNLIPVYKIGVNKKKNSNKEKYDIYRAIYLDKNELDSTNYNTDLIPRNDFVATKYCNGSDIYKTMMMYKPIKKIDAFYTQKKNHNK